MDKRKKKMYFPHRLAEPKDMGKVELDVFEKISRESQKRWNLPFLDFVLKSSSLEKGNILDVGSGPGFLARDLAKKSKKLHVIGLDVSQYAVSQARKNGANIGNLEFKKGSVYNLPFPDNFFDVVICKDSFHQFPNKPVQALKEMLRVVKKDEGLIYINDLRRDVPLYLINRVVPPNSTFEKLLYYSARAAYTKIELQKIIEKAGGKCITVTTRKVTDKIKRLYEKEGIDPRFLKESFQSRYLAVIKNK